MQKLNNMSYEAGLLMSLDMLSPALASLFIVMLRYPENPDPDRSGSRSRTDLRANPEPDSGFKKKIIIIFFFFKFASIDRSFILRWRKYNVAKMT